MGITLSAIVTGCERSISIPSAIKAVNNSIFSATETINRATFPMIFLLQRTIPLPNTIVDATPTIIGGSQITAPEVQIIIFANKDFQQDDVHRGNDSLHDGNRFPQGGHDHFCLPHEFLGGKSNHLSCKKTACADETIPSMTRSLILRSFA